MKCWYCDGKGYVSYSKIFVKQDVVRCPACRGLGHTNLARPSITMDIELKDFSEYYNINKKDNDNEL